MNPNPTATVLAMLLASAIGATPAAAGEIRDRISAEDLQQIRARTRVPQSFQPSAREGAGGEAATAVKKSIIDDSTILSAGSTWTIVPKGSVLRIPDRLRSHVTEKPTGTLVPWMTFLRNNIAWLSTEHVSVDTATGRSPMPEARAEAISRRGRIVVAVYRGGAISLNPPKKTDS